MAEGILCHDRRRDIPSPQRTCRGAAVQGIRTISNDCCHSERMDWHQSARAGFWASAYSLRLYTLRRDHVQRWMLSVGDWCRDYRPPAGAVATTHLRSFHQQLIVRDNPNVLHPARGIIVFLLMIKPSSRLDFQQFFSYYFFLER